MAFRKIEVKPNIDLTESGLYHEKDYIGTNSGSIINIVKDNLFFKEEDRDEFALMYNMTKIELIKIKLGIYQNSISSLRDNTLRLMSKPNINIFNILGAQKSEDYFNGRCVRCGKVIPQILKNETCNNCDIEIEEGILRSHSLSYRLMMKSKKINKW